MSEGSHQARSSIKSYTARASKYDTSKNAFHAKLGLDFVKWIAPESGDAVLDLACGTGLVTLPAAAAVGPLGQAIGIDITTAMLDEGRKKPTSSDWARITWIEHDVTSISHLSEIQQVVTEKGGFDIITCCSALVLLSEPLEAVKSWVELLKPGGRIIVDVLTPARTTSYLFTVALPKLLGLDAAYNDWVSDIHSLERVFLNAGLEVERSFEHLLSAELTFQGQSFIGEHYYEASDRAVVFEEQIQNYKTFQQHGKVEEARQAWSKLWDGSLSAGGQFHDGNWIYVTIGRKL